MRHVLFHIDEWVREHPEDRARLTDSDFLHRASAEAFRLHQTTPARFRAAVRDVTLSTGRKVRAGEMVALHAPVANTSESVFGDDARYFNPWRETPAGYSPGAWPLALALTVAWGATWSQV